ncbi:MAG TPA: tetratricopeptide repeat protein [Candidatus Manganitrophaceae bacterium]|nr:tetratricopeptide repeat protein [Candidatus Manganitrophaceae bacterium]
MKENCPNKSTESAAVFQGSAARLRHFRKNVFWGTIVVSAFFVILELALALLGIDPVLSAEDPFVGFAKSIPLFVEERQADGSVLLKTARNKWNWFNRDQAFPKEKANNSYRIFCMGESTTYGHPYDDRVSFCGWLRAYLKAADPSRNWEVINAGGISYASYRIAKLTEELKGYQPDLFIFYVGQNEFLERRSYGRLRRLPAGVLRVSALLSRTRTWAAMEKAVEIVRPDSLEEAKERYELSGEVDEILKHTLGPTSYHRNDTLHRQIIEHYRFGLGRMARIAKTAGAQVLFVQPAINLKDLSPFKSEHKEGLGEAALGEWEGLYQRAGERHREGDWAGALALYRRTLEIDDRYAEAYYRIGQLLFELKQYDAAEQAFLRAVDEDVAPLRILSPMQQIVKEVAAEEKVPLVDFPQILKEAQRRHYPHAILGREYFVDHVHTGIEGYRLLGLALVEEMIRQGIVTPARSWDAAAVKAVDQAVIAGVDRHAEALALKNLAKTFDWAGKYDEARGLFLQALETLGPDPEIYRRLGTSSIIRQAYDEAIVYFSKVALLAPDWPDIHYQLARLSVGKGKIDEAIGHFQEELRRYPENAAVHIELAVVLARKGENGEARRHLNSALELDPDLEAAHLNLAVLSEKEGRDEEVLMHSLEVLRLNPSQHLAHLYLGVLFRKQGKIEEAIGHLSEAVRLKPDNPVARKILQEALADRVQ